MPWSSWLPVSLCVSVQISVEWNKVLHEIHVRENALALLYGLRPTSYMLLQSHRRTKIISQHIQYNHNYCLVYTALSMNFSIMPGLYCPVEYQL